MNYIDLKYSRLVTSYLERVTWVSQDLVRFRCPFCGDSKKSETKTRGYFYSLDDSCIFKCHNCGTSMGLYNFLKEIAPALGQQYSFERFSNHKPQEPEEGARFATHSQERLKSNTTLNLGTRITDLPQDHHARRYLNERRIPTDQQSCLYWVEDIHSISNQLDAYRGRQLPDLGGIIIPFYGFDGSLEYLQCRFLEGSMRYMTFQIEEDGKKIWGRDRIDFTQDVWVCEGPFDAMLVDNCIAMAGAGQILSELKYIQGRCKANLVLIFDKDYKTNAEVYQLLHDAIKAGHSVVLFDDRFQGKDINDEIQTFGTTQKALMKYLRARTFQGLKAELELSKFRPPIKSTHGKKRKAPTFQKM